MEDLPSISFEKLRKEMDWTRVADFFCVVCPRKNCIREELCREELTPGKIVGKELSGSQNTRVTQEQITLETRGNLLSKNRMILVSCYLNSISETKNNS